MDEQQLAHFKDFMLDEDIQSMEKVPAQPVTLIEYHWLAQVVEGGECCNSS